MCGSILIPKKVRDVPSKRSSEPDLNSFYCSIAFEVSGLPGVPVIEIDSRDCRDWQENGENQFFHSHMKHV